MQGTGKYKRVIRLGKGSGFLFYFRVRSFSIFAYPAISEPGTGLTVRCYHESAVQADQRKHRGCKVLWKFNDSFLFAEN